MVARLRDAIQRGTTAAKPAATAVDVGTLYFDTDLDKMQRSNGTSWDDVERADPSAGSGTVTVARKAALQTSSGTAFADSTSLTFAVSANTDYHFRFVVFFFGAAATTGLRLAINGPAGATGRWGGYIQSSAASNAVGIAASQVTAFDTAIFATTSGPGPTGAVAIVEGILRVGGTAGTLALRQASEVAADIHVEENSFGVLTQL